MRRSYKIIVVLLLILLGFSTYAANTVKVGETKEKGEGQKKIMYLTFDDGPSEYTEELLDLLAMYHMKATFFMLDGEMKRQPEVVRRIITEGHAVGLHGVSHEKNLFYAGPEGPLKEIEQANQTLEEITGKRTHLVRTPYGSNPYLTTKQYDLLCQHDYIVWDWNIDSRDWYYRNAQRTFNATTQMIRKTSVEPKVILFHDIKNVIQTLTLFLDWMEKNDYVSQEITSDITPVKLNFKSK